MPEDSQSQQERITEDFAEAGIVESDSDDGSSSVGTSNSTSSGGSSAAGRGESPPQRQTRGGSPGNGMTLPTLNIRLPEVDLP